MVLYFIDDILELPSTTKLSPFGIYKKIIDDWFERELASSPAQNTEITVSDLYAFSKKISLCMYEKWRDNKTSSLTKEEYARFLSSSEYTNSPYSFRSRSLINRTNEGDIKFSHRSFWEFFLAIISMEHPKMSFDPTGFEMAVSFSEDIYETYLSRPLSAEIQPSDSLDDCIEFPNPDLFISESFSDSRSKIVSALKRDAGDIRAFRSTLLPFWETLILDLPFLESQLMTFPLPRTGESESAHYANMAERVQISLRFWGLLNVIQDSFLDKETPNCLETATSIDIALGRLSILSPDDGQIYEFDPEAESQNLPVFIFPYLIGYEQMLIEEALSKRCIVLVNGFCKDDRLFHLINKSLKITPGICIFLYKEYDSTDDFVRFILSLVQNVPKISNRIILILPLEETTVYYLIDRHTKDYDEHMIRTCIGNMIQAKRST